MTAYIKLSTLEYPRHEGDIRLEHPEITEDQTGDTFSCPPTYAPVEYVPAPAVDTGNQEIAEPLPPVNENGVWKTAWRIRVLSDDEFMTLKQMELDMRKKLQPDMYVDGTSPTVIG